MVDTPQPMALLFALLAQIDGQGYASYQQLAGRTFAEDSYHLRFVRIQGSPGAFPASVCELGISTGELGLADHCLATPPRELAAADFLIRAFASAVAAHTRQNRGVQGSGSFQPLSLPPQVLERNVVKLTESKVHLAFHLSLPASSDHLVLGGEAKQMFAKEFPAIVAALKGSVRESRELAKHCDTVEDMVVLQRRLPDYGLVAFVGDGAILPRQSGISQAPRDDGALPLQAPEELAVHVNLRNGGRVRGLGIRPGITALIGGGFHGKSTLLEALAKGVYPHIPGDGRERVVTHAEATVVCAEEGRAVTDLDITGFIDNLPGGVDARRFSSGNASGSTSQAAAVIETVLAGAKLLLIDEDSSATNFLAQNRHLRALLPEETITPLFDRVEELYHKFGVSTLLAIGASSEYLGAADQVIAMRSYQPACLTKEVRQLALTAPPRPDRPLRLHDKRRLLADNFAPAYQALRLAKTVAVRIKPLRQRERVLEYGNELVDLTRLSGLVDPTQVLAVGYALLLAGRRCRQTLFTPAELAADIDALIAREGLEILAGAENAPIFFARPRRLELAGAINRLRSLKITVIAE